MNSYLKKAYLPKAKCLKKRAQAVCEEALNQYAKINLPQYLLLGKGWRSCLMVENPSIIADAFEAIFGAVFVEKGLNEAKKLFNRIVVPHLDQVPNH